MKKLIALGSLFLLCACSTTEQSVTQNARDESSLKTSLNRPAVETPLSGVWKLKIMECAGGKYTEEGKKAIDAIKSGSLVYIMRIQGSQSLTDVKSLSFTKNGHCRAVVKETIELTPDNSMTVSDTQGETFGYGDYPCTNTYSVPGARTHKIELKGDTLKVFPVFNYTLMNGDAVPSKPLCVNGKEVVVWHRLL